MSLQTLFASASPSQPAVIKICNARVLRGGKLVHDDLWLQGGRILDPQCRFWDAANSRQFAADLILDAKQLIIAPGFIDLQINGAFGVDFSSVDPRDGVNAANVAMVRKRLLEYGVTAFCPTVITSTPETYRAVLPLLGPIQGDKSGASVLGAHCEGPFISDLKYGAHPQHLVRSPKNGSRDLLEVYGDLSNVRLVTLAPELEGALDCLRELRRRGVVVSAGHSSSSLKQAELAVDAGVSMVTHLYNAMQPFHHRDPGLIGLLTSNSRQLFYSLIADGVHSDPASVRMAHLANPHGIVLVTDAIQAAGLHPGDYHIGSSKVTVTASPARAFITGTETIAGSIADMNTCVRNFHRYSGCTQSEALLAASAHPAQALGLFPKKGSLEYGADADLVVVDDELRVHAVFVKGDLAFTRSDSVFAFSAPPASPSPLASPSAQPSRQLKARSATAAGARLVMMPYLHAAAR